MNILSSPVRHDMSPLYFSKDKHFESFNFKYVQHEITNAFHLKNNFNLFIHFSIREVSH